MAKRTKAQENALMLDPNRAKIAKNMAVLPGGPGQLGENNNPMNVTSIGPQSASMENGISRHPYGDTGANYRQMGADIVNPMMVQNSGLPQNFPVGGRGFQAQTPYGMQNQPDTKGAAPVTDMMEASRYNMSPMMQDKPQSAMGLTGLPAQPAPGAFPSQMPGTNGPGFLPTEGSGMVPGSTPQKITKKKGGKK